MDKWIRNPSAVKSNFKQIADKWVCVKESRIYFPKHFEEKSLADVGDEVHVVGLCMITVGTTYAVLNVNAMITFTPSETNTVDMQGGQYYEMVFDPGSTVIENINVVAQDTLPYYIYDTLISKGKIPWYLNYVDMCSLFQTSSTYAGANIGSRPEVIELMISLIARDKQDRNIYYRQIVKSKENLDPRLVFIPIKSVEYGATNTVNKLGGAYFQTGVASALINPSEEVENIESILRY